MKEKITLLTKIGNGKARNWSLSLNLEGLCFCFFSFKYTPKLPLRIVLSYVFIPMDGARYGHN